MRPRRCFLSLLLLLCSLPLLAQEYKLSGRVTGGEGEAVVGARVTLSHEGQILAFAFTRKGGRFALTSDRSYPRMMLSISHLSYETDSISLTPDRHEVTLRLSPRVSQLQEVTVEAYPIIERSDTLTYLLRSFTEAGDYTLEDAIKRLPGVEVDPKGQISYLGKAISHFYIEGMDLLGGQYHKATRNLDAKKVASVDVMRHHQDRKVDKDVPTNDVALNVRLEKDAKSRPVWSGSGAIGYGGRVRYDTSLSSMLFAHSMQYMALLSGGNQTERARDDALDLIVRGDSPTALAERVIGDASASAPPIDRELYISPLDLSVSGSVLRALSDDRQLRVQARYGRSSTGYGYAIERHFADGTVISEESNPTALVHLPGVEIEYRDNQEGYFLSNSFVLDGKISDDQLPTLLGGGGSHFVQKQSRGLSLLDEIAYSRRRGTQNHRVEGRVSLVTIPDQWMGIGSADEISLRQYAQGGSVGAGATYTLSETKGAHRLHGTLGLTYSGDHVETYQEREGADRTALNDLDVSTTSLGLSTGYTYTRPRGLRCVLNATLALTGNYLSLRNSGDQPIKLSRPIFTINPSLSADFALSPFSEVSLGANYSSGYGGAASFLSAPIRTGLTQTTTGSGTLSESSMINVTGDYRFSQPMKMWFVRLSGGYTRIRSNTLATQTIEEDMIGTGALQTDNTSHLYSGDLTVTKRFHAYKTALRFYTGVSRADYRVMQNEVLLPYSSTTMYVTPELSTTPIRGLELSYSYNLSRMMMSYGGTSAQPVISYSHRAGVSVPLLRGVVWRTNCRVTTYTAFEGPDRTFPQLSTALSYRQKSFSVDLRVLNLLNHQSYRYLTFDTVNRYAYRYDLRPRTILLSLQLSL